MARRATIGDIYEFETPCGLAYLQYALEHDRMGSLVRVLEGLFPERPADPAALAATHRFFVFVPIGPAVRDGDMTLVGNADVPAAYERMPIFRHEMGGDPSKYGYVLSDGGGKTIAKRKTLSEAEQLIPGFELWDFSLLAEQVGSAWSWAHDVGPVPRPDPAPATPCFGPSGRRAPIMGG